MIPRKNDITGTCTKSSMYEKLKYRLTFTSVSSVFGDLPIHEDFYISLKEFEYC